MPSKVLKVQPSSCGGCASLRSALDERDRRIADLLRRIAELEGERAGAAEKDEGGAAQKGTAPYDESEAARVSLLREQRGIAKLERERIAVEKEKKLADEKLDEIRRAINREKYRIRKEKKLREEAAKAQGIPSVPVAGKGPSKNAGAQSGGANKVAVTVPVARQPGNLGAARRTLPSSSLSSPTPIASPATPTPASAQMPSMLPWVDQLEQLCKFHAQNGHFLVNPKTKLGKWVRSQELEYFTTPKSSSQLSNEQRAALDSIGFRSIRKQRSTAARQKIQEEWSLRIDQAKAFKLKHGHLAPTGTTANKTFFRWVTAIRGERRKRKEGKPCKLTKARISELDKLGFIWDPAMHKAEQARQHWVAMFQEFIRFRDEIGPNYWNAKLNMADQALCKWVKLQQEEYKKMQKGLHSAMTEDKVEKLEAAGFEWETSCTEAASGKSDDGGSFDRDLQAIEKKIVWDKKFQSLKKFKAAYGHIDVPKGGANKAYKSLKGWLDQQRRLHHQWKEGKTTAFTEEKKLALEAIGYDFAYSKQKVIEMDRNKIWKANFDRLTKLKTEHGSFEDIPKDDPIHLWMESQRKKYKYYLRDGKRSDRMEEQKAALDILGFDWRTYTQRVWGENLNRLREFKRTNGHVRIPEDGHPLSKWAMQQRQVRAMSLAGKRATTTEAEERFAELEELGFEWEL